MDGEPGGHGADLLEVPVPGGVRDKLGEERKEVEKPEDQSDGRGGVADGGGNAEAEEGDENEVEN